MKVNQILAATMALGLISISAFASSTKPYHPIPTPFTKVAAPKDPDHFSFVVTGDNRSTGHGYPMPPAFDEICQEIGLVHPPFVLWTGDDINGYGDTVAEANGEYDTFLASEAKTGVPVFSATGNHEYSLDPDLLPVWLKRIGALYGSFDYGNSHFISVNTTPVMPDGSIQSGTLDPDQWAWLESDLKANQGATNIFVFLHHYVYGPPGDDPTLDTGWDSKADRDRVHALFVKYHVRAVFMGHDHLYWHKVIDGVEYFIAGGAGSPLDASPDQGGFLHYVVVNVDGAKITPTILQPWHLLVSYSAPQGQAASSMTAQATNTNWDPVTVTVPFTLAAPPAGQTYSVTASIVYKKKAKPATATIISVEPGADGKTDIVQVSAELERARTTEITVTPVSK